MNKAVKAKAAKLARAKYAQSRGGGRVSSLDELMDEGVVEFAGGAPGPDRELQAAQILSVLHWALKEIKETHANLLRDRYFLGLDYKELADNHGLSEGSVGIYLKRGLEELREVLSRKGLLLKKIEEFLRSRG